MLGCQAKGTVIAAAYGERRDGFSTVFAQKTVVDFSELANELPRGHKKNSSRVIEISIIIT